MSEFDPAAHRMVPEQRWFDDFRLGERFVLPSRTMTEALFLAFQAASGDNHPVHYDVEYCRARGLPGMLAHGFQTLIQTAPGAGLFPFVTEDSLVGFLEQSSRFLKPVFAGDTLYPALEVDELSPNRTHRRGWAAQHGAQPAARNWCWRAASASCCAGAPRDPLLPTLSGEAGEGREEVPPQSRGSSTALHGVQSSRVRAKRSLRPRMHTDRAREPAAQLPARAVIRVYPRASVVWFLVPPMAGWPVASPRRIC